MNSSTPNKDAELDNESFEPVHTSVKRGKFLPSERHQLITQIREQLPKKKEIKYSLINHGWNDCIDEVLKVLENIGENNE